MATAIPHVSPTFGLKAFNCAYCSAYSAQKWLALSNQISVGTEFYAGSAHYHMSKCGHCGEVATWFDKVMIVPEASAAPRPHSDMPIDLAEDFEEARSVLQRSPRSAAALSRLCLQKLCKVLGESGTNINEDIASLVRKGLPVEVQQSLDIVRVVGNEQVHPGQLDLRDDPALAVELFILLNFIVEDRISRPRVIKALYDRLPEAKIAGIRNRDDVQN